ncbi:hypothetical protein, partial [uncultured Treponema sp.]|uniref:hypothetical protein n=1 Tax=uncultured Treponema sp. TaxID=162155 RepID=UPI0025DE95AD
ENQFGYERFVHDCISREKYAFNNGHAAGLAEGERKKALETARRFLQMGLPVEQIAQGVGLSVEEIQNLS